MTRKQAEKTLEQFKSDEVYQIGSAALEITDTTVEYVLFDNSSHTGIAGGLELDRLRIVTEVRYGIVFVSFSYDSKTSFTISKELA